MNVAVAQSSLFPSPERDLRALLEILERVEELPSDACGSLLFADAGGQKGALYIERGRLCWAVSRGMGRRLTDLVLQEAASTITREQIDSFARTCRDEGRPWGQTLVEQGIVDSQGLRSALGRHTAEALSAMSAWARPTFQWLDRGQVSYDAMFTFGTAEVAALVGGLDRIDVQRERTAELTAVVPAGVFGAAYAWPHAEWDQLPLAAVGAEERSVETAVDLGKWAHNQLELSRAMAQECSPVTALSDAGGAVVAWTSREGFGAAVCDSFSATARLLSNHVRLARIALGH